MYQKILCFIIGMSACLSPLLHGGQEKTEEERVFTRIYENGEWGRDSQGDSTSGPGSTMVQTTEYRKFLQAFLKNHNIHSVIDIGCGRWEFSRTIDWSGIQYTGYDVVKSVVDKNTELFGADNIKFVHGNALFVDLPKADLLLCKDVLQHLPNKAISLLIKKFYSFPYCLITNDVDPITYTSNNPDFQCGDFRGIDLAKAPFCVPGRNALIYRSGDGIKTVFLISNPKR